MAAAYGQADGKRTATVVKSVVNVQAEALPK
jgi:hypothetical protein